MLCCYAFIFFYNILKDKTNFSPLQEKKGGEIRYRTFKAKNKHAITVSNQVYEVNWGMMGDLDMYERYTKAQLQTLKQKIHGQTQSDNQWKNPVLRMKQLKSWKKKSIPVAPQNLFCIASMAFCQLAQHCYRLAGNVKPTFQ